MSYHNGSVWPHDNALIALGLARYGLKRRSTSCSRACSTPRPTWTCGDCRNCSAASSASAAAGRRSIPSPARRRPGRAPRRSRCSRRRSVWSSIRDAMRCAFATGTAVIPGRGDAAQSATRRFERRHQDSPLQGRGFARNPATHGTRLRCRSFLRAETWPPAGIRPPVDAAS